MRFCTDVFTHLASQFFGVLGTVWAPAMLRPTPSPPLFTAPELVCYPAPGRRFPVLGQAPELSRVRKLRTMWAFHTGLCGFTHENYRLF